MQGGGNAHACGVVRYPSRRHRVANVVRAAQR